ncbi:Peroxin 13, N-terminal region-domain-containing protein [Neocallimastix sp. 'constans']|jgi:peroxin-13
MVSPPKPWERGHVKNTNATTPTATPETVETAIVPANSTVKDTVSDATAVASTSNTPALPPRPTTSSLTRTGLDYDTTYGSSLGYSSLGYGGYGSSYGYGGYSSYSPYSRFGSYGGYGGLGYSSYGGLGYGYNRMGYGYPGMMNNEFSLTRQMEESTQTAFQTMSSIVQAFGGFAQMLDSTFMATHSSFMAMVGVADQLSHLRVNLGEVLSIFNIVKYIKRWLGFEKPNINASEFESFSNNPSKSQVIKGGKRQSSKPVILFVLFMFGLPYLMTKVINIIRRRQQQQLGMLPGNVPMNPALAGAQSLSTFPRNAEGKPIIEFARCLYDFQAQSPMELDIKKGDIIAIISKLDQNGQPSQWWKGRLQHGPTGIFPSNYVDLIPTKQEKKENPETSAESIKQDLSDTSFSST